MASDNHKINTYISRVSQHVEYKIREKKKEREGLLISPFISWDENKLTNH